MAADWIVNQRVRFYSDCPEREPEGTVSFVYTDSEHILVEWDDGHRPTRLGFLEANRKLEWL